MTSSPIPLDAPRLGPRLVPGPGAATGHGIGRGWLIVIALAAIARLVLAAVVTEFVLVDDAYITLRYARNAAMTGSLVYNPGELVFGVTSPLWGFVTWALYALVGAALVAPAVIVLGVTLWSLAAIRLAPMVHERARPIVLAGFLCAPVFVDNQMLGMETPLFVFLAVSAMAAALGINASGGLGRAALWTGLLVVARPEGVLLAPALLYAASTTGGGFAPSLRKLTRPASLACLLTPGILWIAYAMTHYGTVLPQSMVAKSGWNSEHYDTLATASNMWLGLARLTFVPFVDYLPSVLAQVVTGLVAAGVLWIAWLNIRAGSQASRAWLLVYGVYIAFYLLGKGATEASWYAVPSSVALLLAAGPAFGGGARFAWPASLSSPRAAGALALGLSVLSVALVAKRAPLLHSYVDGYGACADALDDLERPSAERVLIGEIGVFGFETHHDVIDVGALVSPEILPLKNRRLSLLEIARETRATWLVISDIAVEKNMYPSVGVVFANAKEQAWLASSEVVHHALDKRLIRLAPWPDEIASVR